MGAGLITYNLLFIAILKCIRLLVLFWIFSRTWNVMTNIAIANKLRKYIVIIERKNKFKFFFFISIFCCKKKVRWEKFNPITWFVVAVMILIGAIPMASGLDYSKWFMVQRKLQLSQLAISKTTTKVCPCISSLLMLILEESQQ